MQPSRKSGRRSLRPVHPFDVEHGTDTGALIPGDDLHTGHRHDMHITAYHATAPSLFGKLLIRWQSLASPVLQKTAFLDIGAGKGRAMLLAAEHPFRSITGVELHPALAAIARHNIDRFRAVHAGKKLPPMRLLEDDVMKLRMPVGPCCVFLFNPFGEVLLDRFAARLVKTFACRPQDLHIIYANDEGREALGSFPKLEELGRGRIFLSHQDRDADKRMIRHWADGAYVTSGYEDCGIWRMKH